MASTTLVGRSARWLAASAGVAAGAYAAHAGMTWYRYGRPRDPLPGEEDPLLDSFMPACEVVERHSIHVAAPPEVTLAVARELPLSEHPVVRAIFKGRELILGATPPAGERPRGLIAEVQSLGWGVLAQIPGREIVMGAVTRPWEANVTFRAIPPAGFATFAEPDYVKIAWTLRADPVGAGSIFRTETRAVATDARARRRFRRYWAWLAPGIVAIRWASLGPVKKGAERRAARPARREKVGTPRAIRRATRRPRPDAAGAARGTRRARR